MTQEVECLLEALSSNLSSPLPPKKTKRKLNKSVKGQEFLSLTIDEVYL
jgi:hypothetical protein